MNILFVTYNTCARAAKEARALESAGHQVIVLQHVAVSEEILYATELASFYNNDQALIERVAYFGDWAEVIHVHNEPNWIVNSAAAARDMACPLVPVVFDVHDLDSMREEEQIDLTEEPAIKAADAFIFPSKAYEDGITGLYFLKGKPRRVIYSMCSRQDIVHDQLPRVNGLVYEGAIVAPLKAFNPQTIGYKQYRDYMGLAGQLTLSGIPFHLYGVRKEFQQPYLSAGAVVHDMHRFPDMMRQLSRYDWGLCGHLESHPQWQKAMPNKLFEYIAAGIPVISINASEVGEFISRQAVGVTVKDAEEISAVISDNVLRDALAETVREVRYRFTMESQVPEIEAFYAEAAAYRKSRLGPELSMRHGADGIEADGSWVCGPGSENCPEDRIGRN